ncbi:MAG: Similar to F420-dependent glucose-6-phosphate dehydrogenase, Mext_1273 family, partial [uncultured Chloroflexia bacterium]
DDDRLPCLSRNVRAERAAQLCPAGRGCRFWGGDVFRPLLPLERAAGTKRLCLVVAWRSITSDEPILRSGQCSRPTLQPCHRRASCRHPSGNVRGSIVGRHGQRTGA